MRIVYLDTAVAKAVYEWEKAGEQERIGRINTEKRETKARQFTGQRKTPDVDCHREF